MRRKHILFSGLLFPLDWGIFFATFFIAAWVRASVDISLFTGIPIQKIAESDLMHFAVFGAFLFCIIAFRMGLYSGRIEQAKAVAITTIPRSTFIWFLSFIAVVYLGNGYLYTVEIPRLVIFYVIFLATPAMVFSRYALRYIYSVTLKNKPDGFTVYYVGSLAQGFKEEYEDIWNAELQSISIEQALEMLRTTRLDTLLIGSGIDEHERKVLLDTCRIYGVTPRLIHLPDSITQTTEIEFVGRYPTLQVKFIRIEVWGRILKRVFDFVLSTLGLILLSPVFCLIAILIWIEDSSGPIIYKNVRVGRNGKLFTLYKFRYMYWKYCVKDAYGVSAEKDEALAIENSLAQSSMNTRSGPIYKIQDNSRKMKIGKIIEGISFDELPQLFNVFKGDMSLVGPRPHQPREVEKYDEWHKQVLTIKPGITGMAQVYARESENFDREVELDRFYIENWSWLLDVKLLVKTLGVIWVAYKRKNRQS